MERPFFRKPRLHFDTASQPSHVTFDDGKAQRQNLPWLHYAFARCDPTEPDIIKMSIGDFLIVITGINIDPLFLAIEERTLMRVRAQPDLAGDLERDGDTIVTSIQIMPAPAPKGNGPNTPPSQGSLGLS